MARRRTLLLITEGTSDANALVAPLQNLLEGVRVGDFQVRCDVTVARLFPAGFRRDHGFTPGWDVGRTVDGLVDEYRTRESKSVESLGWIVQLTDLDGAYIPDEAVGQEAGLTGRRYSTTGIVSPDRDATLAELAEKRRCIDFLVDTKTDYRRASRKQTWRVPYRLFYMSRNLEHALHGIDGDLDRDEKDDFASNFASDNLDPSAFRTSLERASRRHGDSPDWESSWRYARDQNALHSLESGSNLAWIEDFVATHTAGLAPARTAKDS